MTEEITNEQKKMTEEAISNSQNTTEDAPKENQNDQTKIEDSDFLSNAKKLKEDQENLIREREKLEADKKEFNEIMRGREQRGRAMMGKKELTPEEVQKENAKKLVEGTGLDPFA